MTEPQAIALLLRTFPKTKIVPRLVYSPPLAPCVVCGESSAIATMSGVHYHRPCLDQHLAK